MTPIRRELTVTTVTHHTEIEADPTVPLIRITRDFDAPPAKVFRAHTDAELIVKWLGPCDLEMHVDTFDCRSGGSYRYVHTGAAGEFGFHGCFHEVRPPDLIIQTFTFEGVPEGVALERLTLEELPGGRTRLVVSSLVESFEARDAILASGMDHGVREGYDKLDGLLAP
jgi:uncharacterized protein YndB with AHSA1/START domain